MMIVYTPKPLGALSHTDFCGSVCVLNAKLWSPIVELDDVSDIDSLKS
jgi:hypothetical protein